MFFERIWNSKKCHPSYVMLLTVPCLQIYNENVHDLLNPSGPLNLRDGTYGVIVSGLHSQSIATAQELLDMLDKGNKNRTQHPTDANAESSRSHAVFQVNIQMIRNLQKCHNYRSI